MLCLKDGESTVGDLEKLMSRRSSTILHAVKEMTEEGLIKRTGRGYALTNVGTVQALLLDELLSALVVMDSHKDYWLNHDLSSIPTALLRRIGMLANAEIISGDPAALLRSHEIFVSHIMKAKEIHGVSPIIIPEYPRAIAWALQNGAVVELILTESIMQIVRKDYADLMNDLLKNERFHLYEVKSEAKVAFTVIDSLLSLGLFRSDGVYDIGRDLVCISDSAAQWGMMLFDHYHRRSTPITGI
jgi:predicted transcriptional regulator